MLKPADFTTTRLKIYLHIATIAGIATVGELEAESWQNPPDLENQFLHRRMWYSTDFKTAYF
jgi:hypothetical protein